jgi:hypothetical protein
MKYIILLSILFYAKTSHAQLVAREEMKVKIEGICDNENVYVLYNGWDGQVEAKCSLSKDSIQNLLNKVDFLKNNPNFKGKGMASVYINCKGEPIGWKISGNTNSELDKQLLEVFKSLTEWSVGKLNKINVDSVQLISYKIKKGKLIID